MSGEKVLPFNLEELFKISPEKVRPEELNFLEDVRKDNSTEDLREKAQANLNRIQANFLGNFPSGRSVHYSNNQPKIKKPKGYFTY